MGQIQAWICPNYYFAKTAVELSVYINDTVAVLLRGHTRVRLEDLVEVRLRAEAGFKRDGQHRLAPRRDEPFGFFYSLAGDVGGGGAEGFLEGGVQIVGRKIYLVRYAVKRAAFRKMLKDVFARRVKRIADGF